MHRMETISCFRSILLVKLTCRSINNIDLKQEIASFFFYLFFLTHFPTRRGIQVETQISSLYFFRHNYSLNILIEMIFYSSIEELCPVVPHIFLKSVQQFLRYLKNVISPNSVSRIQYGGLNVVYFNDLVQNRYLPLLEIADHGFLVVFRNPIWRTLTEMTLRKR